MAKNWAMCLFMIPNPFPLNLGMPPTRMVKNKWRSPLRARQLILSCYLEFLGYSCSVYPCLTISTSILLIGLLGREKFMDSKNGDHNGFYIVNIFPST